MYTAHIIVAAEVGNNAADVRPLLPMLKAVKDNTGQAPEQLLADAGYRSEKNLEDLAGSGIVGVVALGREGKRCAEVDAQKSPHTATMAAKLQTAQGKGGLPQARMDRRSRQTAGNAMRPARDEIASGGSTSTRSGYPEVVVAWSHPFSTLRLAASTASCRPSPPVHNPRGKFINPAAIASKHMYGERGRSLGPHLGVLMLMAGVGSQTPLIWPARPAAGLFQRCTWRAPPR